MKITPKLVQNIKTNISPHKFLKYEKSKDIIDFSQPVIMSVKHKKDFFTLVNMFANSYSNLSTKPQNNFAKIFEGIEKRKLQVEIIISRFLNSYGNITEVVKQKNKILGGFMMTCDYLEGSAYIDFLTLAPEVKKTKIGAKSLLNIAQRIHKHAKDNYIDTITWMVEPSNKDGAQLFGKFPAKTDNGLLYHISVEDFGNVINKYTESM